jgi:hypothetical protein
MFPKHASRLPTSEPTVGSDERPNPDCKVIKGSGEASKKRKIADVRVSVALTRKRRKIAPKTITRRWVGLQIHLGRGQV